jgi:hypothetical protein
MAMIQGRARHAKIVGKPVAGYDEGEKNKVWEFDLVIDEATEGKLDEQGLGKRIKTDDKSGDRYIKFKRKAYKADGEASKPIKIVDKTGKDWPEGTLIGNGSILNVKYNINEWEFGKKKGVRNDVIAVQVWDHVVYEGGEQFPLAVEDNAGGGEVW